MTLLTIAYWINLSFICLFSCQSDTSPSYASSATSATSTEESIIPADLLGTWQEVVDTTQMRFAGTEHQIAFLANDSFNIEIQSFTDAVSADDPCGFRWTHYASGRVIDEDPRIAEAASRSEDTMLLLRGDYTEPSYTHREANCRGEEEFDRLMTIERKTDDTLAITFYRSDPQGEWKTKVNLIRAQN